jgi:SOS-response transcriptional repressor LexA
METMGERLRHAREQAGFKSARSAALKHGWGSSTYAAHENGQNKFDDQAAITYAKAFKVSAGWLVTGDGAPPPAAGALSARKPPSQITLVEIPVAGRVQAGAYLEPEDFGDFIEEPIMAPPDRKFPHARQVAFIVAGDSMNDAKPTPYLPGTYLICVDFEDIERPLANGMKVVIERTRDGGHLREWSVKEVEMFVDRVEYHPRSTNKRFRPIVVPIDAEPEDGQTVRVLALVRRIFNEEAVS